MVSASGAFEVTVSFTLKDLNTKETFAVIRNPQMLDETTPCLDAFVGKIFWGFNFFQEVIKEILDIFARYERCFFFVDVSEAFEPFHTRVGTLQPRQVLVPPSHS